MPNTTPPSLQDAAHFNAYSQYYDLLYQDKDYIGEAAYISALLKQHAGGCKNVLELGCGTGKHAELLARDGFSVTGVELSESMLQQSQKRAATLAASDAKGSFTAMAGDARSFRLDQSFDVVLSLFHVVSYQISNEDANQMFATAAKHLKPEGIFLFDVWYGPAVLTAIPEVRVKRMNDEKIDVLRIAEPALKPEQNRVDVNYTIMITDKATNAVSTLNETHPMRYYFHPELELFCDSHGLTLRSSEQWMSGAAPSQHTWGVTFICQKT